MLSFAFGYLATYSIVFVNLTFGSTYSSLSIIRGQIIQVEV